MNDIDRLRAAVRAHPYEDTPRAMLEDALREDGWRDELAVDSAWKEQLHARQAANLDRAARFVRTRCRMRLRLLARIREALGIGHADGFALVLEPGCAGPRLHEGQESGDRFWGSLWTVTVGAEWVLKWRDEWSQTLLQIRDTDRRIRDFFRRPKRRRKKR